ncbi:MAG: DUF952 domain-containing protein [Actinomycetota bacterium]|nr:DUF952 domain-containing protein [Actinomycetota bacterium]
MTSTRLWHLALAGEWDEANGGAGYRTSTLARTLEDEGFTHCAYAGQVDGVARRFYADVPEPLVLLEIDPSLLTSPVVEEAPDGTGEAFPHVYGPLDLRAVVAAHELARGADGRLLLPVIFPGSAATGPSS